MFIRTVLVLAITLSLVETISYHLASNQIETLTKQQELKLVEIYAERIDRGLKSVSDDVEFLQSLPTFFDYYKNRSFELNEEQEQNKQSILGFFKNLIDRVKSYSSIKFVYEDGTEVVRAYQPNYATPQAKGPRFQTSELIRNQNSADRELTILRSEVEFIAELNEYGIVFAAPLYGSDQKVFGHIEVYYNLESIVSKIREEKIFSTGHLSILSQDGKTIFFPGKEIGSDLLDNPTMKDFFHQARQMEKGNLEIKLDKSYIVGFSKVPTSNWLVLALAPKREMLSVLEEIKLIVVIVAIVSILLEILASVYFLKWVVMSPLKSLLNSTKEIIHGNLETQVKVHAHDELGDLSTSFNIMANHLKDSHDQLEQYGHSLEKKVEERTAELLRVQIAMAEILKNIRHGVFTFGVDGKIDPEYSQHLHVIFAMDHLEGADVMHLLFDQSNINSEYLSQVRSVIPSSIGEEVVQLQLNYHLLPHEIIRESGKQILELDWVPLVIEQGIINKIMVTMRDVTELRQIEQQAQKHRAELEKIGNMLRVDPSRLDQWLTDSRAKIDEICHILWEKPTKPSDYLNKSQMIFRMLHTVKGNTRVYGFKDLTAKIHEAEEFYTLYMARPAHSHWNVDKQLAEIKHIMEIIDQYQAINETKLKQRFHMVGPWHEILKIIDSGHIEDLRNRAIEAVYPSIQKILHPILAQLHELANQLGKHPPEVRILGDKINIHNNYAQLFEGLFTHLFTNALEHGLVEGEKGGITLSMHYMATGFVIRMYDNGRGLALAKLKSLGVDKGLLPAQASPQEIAELVFVTGLSTSRSITEISGRGVGLDAVRAMIEDLGGTIHIELEPSKLQEPYCPFQFVMTYPSYLMFKSHLSEGS